MSRKIVRLTLDHLDALPSPCRSCLFWELDPVRRDKACGHEAEEKAAWVSMVLREWGSCGRVALVDGEVVGHMIWAPPVWVPSADGFATAPVGSDAVLLATAHVDPAHRGGGLGRMLVQGMARDLIERGGFRAVEAFGDTRGRHAGTCVLPEAFLGGVGFKTQRAHSTTPRMRMELRSALTWRDELEVALERLLGVVRPHKQKTPAPTPKVTRSGRQAL